MMKKLLLLISLFIGAQLQGSAQEIFNTILHDAQAVVDDSTSSVVSAKIAQFKVDALKYIRTKAFERQDEVSKVFLDNQAYYMKQFLSTFFSGVVTNSELSKAQKKDLILFFMDASQSNPLYNDPDRELVDAYVHNSKTQFTPFCLDTDWTKAYAAVQSRLKAAAQQ